MFLLLFQQPTFLILAFLLDTVQKLLLNARNSEVTATAKGWDV